MADAPAELSKADRLVLVRLRAEAAALRGDHEGAIALLEEALAEAPATIPLLTQKASSQIALNRLRDALNTVQLALSAFEEQFPNATHPPVTILRLQSRILDRLEGAAAVP